MSTKGPSIVLAVKTSGDAKNIRPPLRAAPSNFPPPLTHGMVDHPPPISFQDRSSSALQIPLLLDFGKSGIAAERSGEEELPAPLEFTHDLHFQRDDGGGLVEYGRGAWSAVHAASSRWPLIATVPPTSPASLATSTHSLAVKSPLRRGAHSILRAEALLLTRLSRIPGRQAYIVPFYGFIPASHSLVMGAIPLTLSAYLTSQAAVARKVLSTKTMFDPVLGMPRWLALVRGLVEGLSWLHNCAQIIHGDIKPQNILLRPRLSCGNSSRDEAYPYDSLFVDFTSSHDLSSSRFSPQSSGSSLSALTPPFAAPELLTVSSLKSADVVPLKASDVFSLAVTLLAAVTGDLLLYPGSSSMQRLAMSRDGHRVLEYVRSGIHGSRIPKNGRVEKVLSLAVLKEPERRIKPDDWLRLIDQERGN